MIQSYKEAFDQVILSDKKTNYLYHMYTNKKLTAELKKRIIMRRLAYILTGLFLFLIPAVTVIASVKIDAFKIFGGLFGDKTKLIEDNTVLPEVKVITDTFKDIDIKITGITGDESVIYVAFEVIKTNETNFTDGEYKFAVNAIAPKDIIESVDFNRFDPSVITDNASYILLDRLIELPDENPTDPIKPFAYIAGMNTEVHEEEHYIPGDTMIFQLMSFYNKNLNHGAYFEKGMWEGEFTAEFNKTESITLDIGKEFKYPEWGTDSYDNITSNTVLESVRLTPIALRFKLGRINENNCWDCIYLEMEDGEIIGPDTFEKYIKSIYAGESEFRSGYNGDCFWVFRTPIDIHRVKAVHFGNLAIEVQENKSK